MMMLQLGYETKNIYCFGRPRNKNERKLDKKGDKLVIDTRKTFGNFEDLRVSRSLANNISIGYARSASQ